MAEPVDPRARELAEKLVTPSALRALVERFERNTIPEPNSGCLLWIGGTTKKGYGCTGVGQHQWLAHRLAWTIANGDIPDGLQVLHSCDNPPCVNLTHLFLGTHDDNMADMVKKGRSARGERRASKLTEESARAILRSTSSCSVLARRYGVSRSTVSDVRIGKLWAHIHPDRAEKLAERLVVLMNHTADSHAVIVVTATLRGALGAAWQEGFDHVTEAPEWADPGQNPFTRGCV